MTRALKPVLVALAALTAAGCASTRPPSASVDSRLRPPPAAAPVVSVKATPLDQLGAEAKLAVFPNLSLQEVGGAVSLHAARCWRGPGAPFADLEIADEGIRARDLSGAEVLRLRYASISPTLNAVAFTGSAFTEDLEIEAADAVRGRSLCAGEIPAPNLNPAAPVARLLPARGAAPTTAG